MEFESNLLDFMFSRLEISPRSALALAHSSSHSSRGSSEMSRASPGDFSSIFFEKKQRLETVQGVGGLGPLRHRSDQEVRP